MDAVVQTINRKSIHIPHNFHNVMHCMVRPALSRIIHFGRDELLLIRFYFRCDVTGELPRMSRNASYRLGEIKRLPVHSLPTRL